MDDAEVGVEAMVAACAFVPADDVQRKREGTATYHALSRRCLQSLVEVRPQNEAEPGRKRLALPELRTLTARS
jgi:phenylacetic acid degradation protein